MTGKEKKDHKKTADLFPLKYSTTQKNYQNLNNWTFISPLDYHYLLMKVSSCWFFFYGFQLSPFRTGFGQKLYSHNLQSCLLILLQAPYSLVKEIIFFEIKRLFSVLFTHQLFFSVEKCIPSWLISALWDSQKF